MPIHEYRCSQCGCEFEELVTSSNTDVPCPECASQDVERLLSAFGMKSGGSYRANTVGSSSCATCSATSCSSCKGS
jgi:putative FmdB family regulatory protein